MVLAKIVFAVFACTSVTKYVFVSSQAAEHKSSEVDTEKTEPPPIENHTFVALIDISFSDGTKRRCTGTIVHDNVLITAAHCFLNHGQDYVDVELSGSFIVLGTKKMFDTGYENYLPIERVVTHPRYKGWTADLALVYTYAGMTTDKPGNILPIVEESEATPVDSNVTILSWGNCCDDSKKVHATKSPGERKRECSSSEDENDSCEVHPRKPLRGGSLSEENDSSSHRSFKTKIKSSADSKIKTSSMSEEEEVPATMNVLKLSLNKDKRKDIKGANPILSIRSPYLIPDPAKEKKKLTTTKSSKKMRYEKAYRNMTEPKDTQEMEQDWTKVLETVIQRSGLNISKDEGNTTHSFNFRRKQRKPKTVKENVLTVETFGFVNVQTCKKLIDKSLPKLYKINTNEVVCYSAEEHFISDDDSGAPAVREGRLVAVTVGGAECEGDHVAIGMKMTCFCSWVLENLPPSDHKLNCCTDCCGEENVNKKDHNKKDDKKDATFLRAVRPKPHKKLGE